VAETDDGHGRTPGEAAEARAYGLTSQDLRTWASFSPIEIYWALKHGLTPTAAGRWAREGLRVCDIVRAIGLRMNPEEVRLWAGAGFAPCDAVEAKEMGVALEAALAWRDAGFILPDAALLIHDGWTLEEAVDARYAGIDDEDRSGGLRGGALVVDAAEGLRESAAGAAPAELDQLGGDGHRRLLGGSGAEVEADGRAQPRQFGFGHADGPQPLEAVLVRAP
jgi:hypothetical protein